MNQNEYNFAKNIVNLDKNVNTAISYIKENFGIDSKYNEETGILELYDIINESQDQIIAIKDYINNNFDPEFLTVNI